MSQKITDKKSGCVFDDFVKQEKGLKSTTSHWTQICKEHVLKCHLPIKHLDDAGQGICGVVNCENEAAYYYDFNGKLLKR